MMALGVNAANDGEETNVASRLRTLRFAAGPIDPGNWTFVVDFERRIGETFLTGSSGEMGRTQKRGELGFGHAEHDNVVG